MKSLALLLLFIFGFSSADLYAVEVRRAEQILGEAQGLIQLGELGEAEKLLKEGLNLHPGNANLRFELANLHVIQHDALQAQNMGEEALSKLKAAARELEKAVMYQPDSVSGYYNLGTIQKNIGRYEDARKSFQKALILDPNQIPAIIQLGRTYEEQGFFEEAEGIYRDAQQRFYDERIEKAILDLKENREYYRMHESRRQQMVNQSQMNSIGNALSDYGSNNSNYFNSPYSQGSNLGYGTNYGSQNQNQNAMGALPLLGQMVAKQLFGSRSPDEEE